MYVRFVKNALPSTLYEECFWIMEIITVGIYCFQVNKVDEGPGDEFGENGCNNPKDGHTKELLDFIKLQKKLIHSKQEECDRLQQSVNQLQTTTNELKIV